MRQWFLGLAVVLAAAGVAAAADDKTKAVIKKAIEAHGGADALNKYTASKFTMKGELHIQDLDLEFTGDVATASGGRFKLNMTSDIMGMKLVIQQVVNGDKVKSVTKVGDVVVPGGDEEMAELKAAAAFQEAEQLTPLLDAEKFTIRSADDEDVNGKKAAVVVIKPKSVDKEMKLYVDKESWLIVKTSHKGLGPGDGTAPAEVLEETYHSEYKKINGIQVATKLVVNHDDKKFLTATLSDYEVLEKIDDKEFTIDD